MFIRYQKWIATLDQIFYTNFKNLLNEYQQFYEGSNYRMTDYVFYFELSDKLNKLNMIYQSNVVFLRIHYQQLHSIQLTSLLNRQKYDSKNYFKNHMNNFKKFNLTCYVITINYYLLGKFQVMRIITTIKCGFSGTKYPRTHCCVVNL